MNYLSLFGKFATILRSMGFSKLVTFLRDSVDYLCLRIGYTPLKLAINGMILCGFLRHRSFLSGLQGGYEVFLQQLFTEALRPGVVVIDGGAHIGLYSIIADQRLIGNGKIFAFEPDPFNFHALMKNLKINRCQSVIAVPKALSSSVGKTKLYVSEGTISTSLFKRRNVGKVKLIEVEMTKLDCEIKHLELESVVIKLDIEGAEPLAIEGMTETIRRAQSVLIFVEMNPSALQAAGFSPNILVHKLQALDLEIFFIDETSRELIPVKSLLEWRKGNLLARKL